MAFYAAGIAAYNGDRQAWASNISQTLRQDGDNPYYRWAVSK
jgi:spermidine synthase